MMDLDEDEGYQLFAKPAERRPAWVFWCSTDFSEEGGSFNSPKLWGKRWNEKKGCFFFKMCLLDGFVEITNEKRMFFRLQHTLVNGYWPVLGSPNSDPYFIASQTSKNAKRTFTTIHVDAYFSLWPTSMLWYVSPFNLHLKTTFHNRTTKHACQKRSTLPTGYLLSQPKKTYPPVK